MTRTLKSQTSKPYPMVFAFLWNNRSRAVLRTHILFPHHQQQTPKHPDIADADPTCRDGVNPRMVSEQIQKRCYHHPYRDTKKPTPSWVRCQSFGKREDVRGIENKKENDECNHPGQQKERAKSHGSIQCRIRACLQHVFIKENACQTGNMYTAAGESNIAYDSAPVHMRVLLRIWLDKAVDRETAQSFQRDCDKPKEGRPEDTRIGQANVC